ncbi:MAG: hypothetical protein LBI55_04285 [Oscillospiraceae bacterium]|jgi:hypothetical protein|nr:hypothetical protein [Oscillospiraceae bacterium]
MLEENKPQNSEIFQESESSVMRPLTDDELASIVCTGETKPRIGKWLRTDLGD